MNTQKLKLIANVGYQLVLIFFAFDTLFEFCLFSVVAFLWHFLVGEFS